MADVAAWPEPLRQIAARDDDAPVELLAMVWGPRFDRQHAADWLARTRPADRQAADALRLFASEFDALPAARQRALREALAHNAACRASC